MDHEPIGIKSDQEIYQYCLVISSSGSLSLDERYIIVNSRILGPSIRGIPPTYLQIIRPWKITDTVNVYQLSSIPKNLWYHFVNRSLNPLSNSVNSSVGQGISSHRYNPIKKTYFLLHDLQKLSYIVSGRLCGEIFDRMGHMDYYYCCHHLRRF